MPVLNKWSVGLLLLIVGVILLAVGGQGTISWTRIVIGLLLSGVGAAVLIVPQSR